MKKWLAKWCLWAYYRLTPRRDVKLTWFRAHIAMPYDGAPFVVDAANGRKVLAPEGCSFHMLLQPHEGTAHLALSVDDPAFRPVLVFDHVEMVRAVEAAEGVT